MPSRRRYVLAAALVPLVACSVGPGGTVPRQSNVITRAELLETGARNLHEAISRLRPRWLMVRSMRSFSMETEIVVFQERALLGNQDQLERLGLGGVFEIRYVDGPTAQATLPGIGDRHIEGAIVVYMSPPDA
jgi:hypothetical protein